MQTPADERSAVALVLSSRLFDERWYAEQCGRSFGSREEAAADYVSTGGSCTPHPLFEDLWLYPQGRWRRHSPDPLSYYLGHPEERSRSPHPLVDLDTIVERDPAAAEHPLGPLDHWLGDHTADDALSPPVAKAPVTGPVTVVVTVEDLPRAVGWMRHLDRVSPEVTGRLVVDTEAQHRILTAAAASLPTIRVHRTEDDALAEPTPVVVHVRPSVNPPRWPWLPDLVAALDRPGVAAAQPLLLRPDFTVAAAGASYTPDGCTPLLAGHPIADAQRIAGLPLPAAWPGVLAVRTGAEGDTVLVPASRVVQPRVEQPPSGHPPEGAPARTEAAWRAAGFDAPGGRPLTVREGRPALRWAIDIAAGAGPIGTRWGDFHFATSLASALERLGQWVAIDHPETRGRATRDLDDVVLTIRGLERVDPGPDHTSLLWVISHPELVTAEECAAYDAVFAASVTWAAERTAEWGVRVEPMLQCTDAERFRPGLAEPDTGPRVLFVGNSRGVLRPAVAAALETGLDLTVYGAGWGEWLPEVAADRVANEELGALYASAGLVLNDHWEDMREQGFVSNRVFDVLACGARLLSDDVAGIGEVLGPAVPVFRDTGDFARLTAEPLADHYPDAAARRATAERVLAEHSFDARAASLLAAALRLRSPR